MSNEDLILRELRSINKTMDEVKEAQARHSVRTQRMERALMGDKEFQQKGLVDEVIDAKKDILDIKTSIENKEVNEKVARAKQKGIVLGVGVAGGSAGYGLVEWIKSFFS